LIFFGECSLQRVTAQRATAFVTHYQSDRSHQGRGNQTLNVGRHDRATPRGTRVQGTPGGLLKYYHCHAHRLGVRRMTRSTTFVHASLNLERIAIIFDSMVAYPLSGRGLHRFARD
jgi:hypothetical protein